MSSSKPPSSKSRKEREREKKERQSQAAATAVPAPTERLKIVVRRLPPNLPEDVFWQSVQQWVTDESVSWKIFYPGKLRKRLNKENIPSRAYILFKTEEQLAQFGRDYDGHLFRDKAGNESYAVVEFAPYQKVAQEKKKVDARSGTIDKDEDYISFIESLNAPANNPEPATLEALIAASQPPPPPKTTPLLEALKAEKAAQKEKESAIRQIAQQKREELKKKNAAAQAQAQANGAPLSKKAAKKAAAAANKPGPAVSGPSNAKTTPQQTVPVGVNTKPPPKAPKGPKAASSTSGPPPITINDSAASARPRPVIGVGLASRQFEAALSGAGVAPGERKSRRERERERVAASASGTSEDATAGNPTTSPKKDKQPPRRKDSLTTAPVHRIDDDVPFESPLPTPQAGLIPVNILSRRRGGRGGGGPVPFRGRGGIVGGGVPVSRVHGGG
ncbi:Smg-4/UPF3 family-domain-containing protein [Mycena amicta]|nr:Smg-4/UPF3 family-domain-containing protein [Mycena amicta]